ncbi:MAG TPA: 16S rRNA (guanine(966)-N(2))-methyltransferase RsmD [Pseudonocardiaceae bacterium]
MTRIVAGVAGGRRIVVPPRGTRPTSERVREALFSALEAVVGVDGARVLDLYAGSGALGLEALSRGATTAVFVESDRRAAELLRRNATSLGLTGAVVHAVTVAAALATPPAEPFDIVLADPPYAVGGEELRAMLDRLVENGWLAPGAVVVLERAVRSGEPDWPPALTPLRSRKYGDTVLHWAQFDDGTEWNE